MKKLFLGLLCGLLMFQFIPFTVLSADVDIVSETKSTIRYELILDKLEEALSYDEYGYPYLDADKVDSEGLTAEEMIFINETIRTSNENRNSVPGVPSSRQGRSATAVILFLLSITIAPVTYGACTNYGGQIWSALTSGAYKALPEPNRSQFYIYGWHFLNTCWSAGW